VDSLTPELNISVSGATGENGWYVSATQVSASAQDNGSGIATLEVSVDGSGYTNYLSPITLSDGIHALQFRATDNAGNVTTTTQDVKVDSITPNLNLFVNGKMGLNSWYVSAAQVSASATDSGSGVASLEVSIDGSAFTNYQSPITLSDGLHTYQARAKDKAGNVTQSPVQNLKVDTIAPFIDMPETLSLGERLYYALQDDGSGLAIYRAVIEDDAEKYKKIVWLETMSGQKVESDIFWDGKFPDAVKAKPGEYFITLKISDAAGNERMMTTRVSVTLLNSLIPLPVFEPPTSAPEPVITPQAESTPSTFGGTTSESTGEITSSPSTIGGDHTTEEKPITTQMVSKAPVTSEFPVPASAILWGAASAAAVGFFVSEAQKRKQEEEQKRREAAEAQQNALAQMFLNDTKPEPTETQEFASAGNDLGADFVGAGSISTPVFAPITAAPITGGGSKPVLTYAPIPFSEMMDACPKLKLAVRAANLAISASNAANTAYSNARHAADSARAEVTQAEDMAKQYAARVLELGKLAAGALKDAVKYSFDQGLAWSKLQVLKGELWAAQKAEDAAYWVYDKAKNAPWWVPFHDQIRDAAWWVYDKARKAREDLERQVQNQQKRYDQISAMAAAARRAATDLTASAAKAAASAAYWGGQVALRRLKAAALELAARTAKLAANVVIGAKEAAERLVASQRVDCQKTLAERQRLESLANQLAALTRG